MIIGGGGYRNIVRCAFQLEQLGHDVSLHVVGTAETDASIPTKIAEHFYPLEGFSGRYEPLSMGGDIVLATHWSTMKFAEAVAEKFGEVMYFVQDFEPAFYAMGSEYLLAEETYRKGYYAITSGAWCEQFLRSNYGLEADHFQFPIDKSIYCVDSTVTRRNRILFFAKPEIARRCFELGVQALHRFHTLRPDVEIAFYGSEFASDHEVPFPVTHHAVLPTLRDLADLYRTSQVGMVFATTNPSLVPYEMMACGLPVADLARPGQEANYGGSFELAKLMPTDPERMGEELAAFIADSQDLAKRSKAGADFASRFPIEAEVGALVESYITRRVAAWGPEQRRRAGGSI